MRGAELSETGGQTQTYDCIQIKTHPTMHHCLVHMRTDTEKLRRCFCKHDNLPSSVPAAAIVAPEHHQLRTEHLLLVGVPAAGGWGGGGAPQVSLSRMTYGHGANRGAEEMMNGSAGEW